ncbi:hypothetical protein niasHS_010561 [Heterodera schachtii]|uniref:Uncharacterized protein n=1 Tax=Heterodera schachtii TaxID=97005 RepID=A0ABD2IRX8_HETSC
MNIRSNLVLFFFIVLTLFALSRGVPLDEGVDEEGLDLKPAPASKVTDRAERIARRCVRCKRHGWGRWSSSNWGWG